MEANYPRYVFFKAQILEFKKFQAQILIIFKTNSEIHSLVTFKGKVVTQDSIFMFWINANDCAYVIVSQYQSALQLNNIVVVTHAYSYQFQLPVKNFVLETKVKLKLYICSL